MWDRKELKARGKAAFYANRVTCIIAALILAIAGGFGGFAAPTFSSIPGNNDEQAYEIEGDAAYDYGDVASEDNTEYYERDELMPEEDGTLPILNMLKASVIVLFVILVIVIVLSIILLNPLNVAMRRFFIDNATDPETGISRKNMGICFGKSWKNIVSAMFVTDVFIFLWSLLLVIPGVYKSYCWRMVPFILSENLDMGGDEARKKSSEMMNGNKWAVFILDLSFLGWRILAIFTLGILNLLFTNPYQACTDAELYLILNQRSLPENVSESNNMD